MEREDLTIHRSDRRQILLSGLPAAAVSSLHVHLWIFLITRSQNDIIPVVATLAGVYMSSSIGQVETVSRWR